MKPGRRASLSSIALGLSLCLCGAGGIPAHAGDAPSPEAEPALSAELLGRAYDCVRRRQFGRALRLYREVSDRWPASTAGTQGQFNCGRLLQYRGKHRDAFAAYQAVIERGRDPEFSGRSLTNQLKVVQAMMAPESEDFLSPGRRSPACAREMLEQVLFNDPRGPLVPEVCYQLGRFYEQREHLGLAVVAYARTVRGHPDSAWAEPAAFAAARCLFGRSQGRPEDVEAAGAALGVLGSYLERHPEGNRAEAARALREQLRHRLAAAEYRKALFYDRNSSRPDCALAAYARFLELYPESEWSDAARLRTAILLRDLVPLRIGVPAG
jgi:tetratricopeptide (TPR) repeat protein